ncbi:MAG: nucleoside triphosphate pyrophosphohydrolase [Myxococcota bacterium]
MNAFRQLVSIVLRLRGEQGCPWDRAQTPASMRPFVLEEAYEVVDAIDRGDDAELKKELGDVLFQIVLLARMAEERGVFTIEDVVAGINDKMIVRHPHVFGDAAADPSASAAEVGLKAWEARKAKERQHRGSALDGLPLALPALLRAHRVSDKAAVVGFDWPDRDSVREKVREELAELDEAIAQDDAEAIGEEFGDLLFSLVNLGRHLPVGAESALRKATSKFERRFRAIEASFQAEGRTVHEASMDELEARWAEVKSKGEAP